MKRFAVTGFLVLIGTLPLFFDLACKVETPGAPNNFPSALGTIAASNPSFTPTPTASPTLTPTVTSTPCVGFLGTPTPGASTFTDGAKMYLNQYVSSSSTTLLTTLKVWTASAVTLEAGVYTDNGSNAPQSLLGESGIENAVAGLNSYDLASPVTLTGSTNYWLALHSSGPVDFTGATAILTFVSPVGTSFSSLPVTVDGGTYQATPVPSSPATLLSLNGTTCP